MNETHKVEVVSSCEVSPNVPVHKVMHERLLFQTAAHTLQLSLRLGDEVAKHKGLTHLPQYVFHTILWLCNVPVIELNAKTRDITPCVRCFPHASKITCCMKRTAIIEQQKIERN